MIAAIDGAADPQIRPQPRDPAGDRFTAVRVVRIVDALPERDIDVARRRAHELIGDRPQRAAHQNSRSSSAITSMRSRMRRQSSGVPSSVIDGMPQMHCIQYEVRRVRVEEHDLAREAIDVAARREVALEIRARGRRRSRRRAARATSRSRSPTRRRRAASRAGCVSRLARRVERAGCAARSRSCARAARRPARW